MELNVKADRTLIRAQAKSRRYVRVELRAPDARPRAQRLPVNLGLVIDRSGSMSGQKIEMARAAVVRAIQTLRPQDRFSVAFSPGERRSTARASDRPARGLALRRQGRARRPRAEP